MGAIQDRTREHLGTADKAIVQYRRLLRQEIEKVASGEKPFMFLDAAHARSIQGPATMDGIGPTEGWETYWMEVDVKRRRSAPWAAPVPADIADKVPHLRAVSDVRFFVIARSAARSNPSRRAWHRMDCFVASLLAMTAVPVRE